MIVINYHFLVANQVNKDMIVPKELPSTASS